MAPERTVSEVGETGLIARIVERIGPGPAGETWGGDDAAVIAAQRGPRLVTTDLMVEGVDFTAATFSPDAIGWKALAVNLSDIAAMGGVPDRAVASLSLRGDIEVSFVDGLLDGLLDAAGRWDVGLVGGDISRAAEVMVSVTVVGHPAGDRAVLRSGARPGDAICVTGHLGGAAGGLMVLRGAHSEDGVATDALVERQRRPQPRVAEGIRIAELGATAMIDLSDGLAVDLGHIVESSGTGCRVDPESIPVDPALAELALVADVEPLVLAITGGEDFELLFTMDESRVDAARSALDGMGTAVTRIGTVVDDERRIGEASLESWRERGWDHLRGR